MNRRKVLAVTMIALSMIIGGYFVARHYALKNDQATGECSTVNAETHDARITPSNPAETIDACP